MSIMLSTLSIFSLNNSAYCWAISVQGNIHKFFKCLIFMITPETKPVKNYIFSESRLLSWQLLHVWSLVNASCVLLKYCPITLGCSWHHETVKKSSSTSARCQATVCFSLLGNTASAQLQLLPKQPEQASVSP